MNTTKITLVSYSNYQLKDLMILPGMLHLTLVQAMLKEGILVAAQNVSATAKGAFTGEVAADQLSDYRIEYVLVG